MSASRRYEIRIFQDIAIIIFSAAVAFFAVRAGIINDILEMDAGFRFIGAFLAGAFFVSLFTVAPSGAVLAGLFQSGPLIEVAFAAAMGGMAGDWLMFRFFRDHVAEDVSYIARNSRFRRFSRIFSASPLYWLTPFIGAVIVASPFPDEIGLALMGVSRLRTLIFIPASFTLNFFGLLAFGFAARALS